MKIYTFDIMVNYNGLKGILNEDFEISDSIRAENEEEAIKLIDENIDKLGYKVKRAILNKIEDENEYIKKIKKESDKMWYK
jgi:phosphomannomutase